LQAGSDELRETNGVDVLPGEAGYDALICGSDPDFLTGWFVADALTVFSIANAGVAAIREHHHASDFC
jgi:hypothetical protein